MLSQTIVDHVRQLLVEGKISQRKIARQLGISRGTVGAIASGKREDYVRKPPEESYCLLPAMRCPGCGGNVHPPCRFCKVRAFRAKELARAKARRRDFLAAAG
jgi:hypothetical protein